MKTNHDSVLLLLAKIITVLWESSRNLFVQAGVQWALVFYRTVHLQLNALRHLELYFLSFPHPLTSRGLFQNCTEMA